MIISFVFVKETRAFDGSVHSLFRPCDESVGYGYCATNLCGLFRVGK